MEQALEAVLFVSVEPISSVKLAKILKTDEVNLKKTLLLLKNNLSNRGIRLVEHDNKYQLVSAPEQAELTSVVIEQAKPALSPSGLEVLTIIAHRQPITKSQIEQIRGVSSDQTIKSLLAKDLIAKSTKKQTPTEPSTYVTTIEFLRQAGLDSIKNLPKVEQSDDR